MGKIRIRVLGLEEVEKKQKEEAKKRREEKKKKKVKGVGLKGGERTVEVEVSEEELKKQKKAEEIIKKAEEEEIKGEGKAKKGKKIGRKKKHVVGRNYQKAKKLVPEKEVTIKEGVKLLRKMHYAKFDESVELHLNVVKSPLKGEVELPYGIGKKIRVAIVNEEVLSKIEKGEIEFDVLISTPAFMPRLAKYAKILGPRGLMPNPKKGTISTNPKEAAKKFTDKLVQWKTEPKFPLVHQAVGKLSFKDEELEKNIEAFLQSVGKRNIKSAFLKATMTPAVKIKVE